MGVSILKIRGDAVAFYIWASNQFYFLWAKVVGWRGAAFV